MNTMHPELGEASDRWTDGKRYWWLLSPALPLIGVLSILAVTYGAHGAWLFALPVIFYGLIYLTYHERKGMIPPLEKNMTDLTKAIYTSADAAREHLESLRWAHGTFCPHCGGTEKIKKLEGKSTRPGVYKCNDCRKPFTVTVGTVFERSKIPLNKWLLAAQLMAASKKGISAHQIHRMLDVTYKSAWFMMHRLREAMTSEGGMLGGGGEPVEVDETYWGNSKPKSKTARGYDHKMKVVSLVERDGSKVSFHMEKVTAATLRPILTSKISKNAQLMTDEAAVYTKVGREFAKHGVINHGAKEYSRGIVSTNTVEASFAILKRGLYGTFHHVGEQHLLRYTTEFDFRWNHRKVNDDQRADAILRGIEGKRLTYLQTGPQ